MEEDRIIWKPSNNGNFTTKSAYIALSNVHPAIRWYGMVWNKMVIPRHSFTAWQLLSGCLPTQDNLMKRRILHTSSCILCNNGRENSKHLFFDCVYSAEVWNHIKGLLRIGVDTRNCNRLWMSIIRICRRKTVAASIYSTMICATVNYIWSERNARRFQDKSQSAVNLKLRLVKERRYIQLQVKEIPNTQ
ncbi:RNA-directed DNA polymerase, eukaryota, Reverse transcriptase zinc-binding domain protein, partial [Thalictrum thalictroides]